MMRLSYLLLLVGQLFHSIECNVERISPNYTLISPNRLNIEFDAFHKHFVLDLEQNNDFISNQFAGFISVDNHLIQRPTSKQKNRCYYRGTISGEANSWVALTYCDSLLNGLLKADGIVYQLRQSSNEKNVEIQRQQHQLQDDTFVCGSSESSTTIMHQRKRRSVYGKADLDTTRFVEIVLVNDFDIYTFYGKNAELIYERNKQLINIVNALYAPLNIKIAIIGSVIWTEKNEIDISKDSSETLTNFLNYRKDVLIKKIPNDNAQLITNSSFESGIVGKALKQTICSYDYSGGINSDYSKSIQLLATTIAHELGHNFGMEHDHKDCVCPNRTCIMGPSSSHPTPKYWSSCSVSQLLDSFAHGMDHCLLNKPKTLFRPNCGNGFLEPELGEECDCGEPQYCRNKCCNPLTCRLKPNAECANGECCDRQTCKVMTKDIGHVCRKAKSICDVAEVCDGTSEFCSKDVHVKDGTECHEGYAYCYAGNCDHREKQCKLLWGDSGEVADYRCFQHNLNASSSGDCGYNKVSKKYQPCKEPKDIICGRLHCTRNSDRLYYGPEGAAIISKSIESRKGKKIFCHSAIIDLGLSERDPGLVPNGAKCGPDAMCVDQQCVPINTFLATNPCPNQCSNNGYCDNEGKCHCFEHFNSYDCSSYSSGLLTISCYIIFFVLLPIGLIVLAVFYYNKQHYFVDWLNQRTFAADYNNKRQKKQPRNFEITLPLERRCNDAEQINLAVSSSNNTQHSAAVLKPIRPAPPKPAASLVGQHPNVVPKTLNRPKMPPPPKPTMKCDAIIPLNPHKSKDSSTSSTIKDLVTKFESS